MKKILCAVTLILFTAVSYSYPVIEDELPPAVSLSAASSTDYTVIPYNYQQVTRASRLEIRTMLWPLALIKDPNKKLQFMSRYFANRPYATSGALGEGNWCKAGEQGCVHIQQDPIYRTDALNCFSMMQMMLPLLHAKNINDYENIILQFAYGAAGEGPDSIAYYNRDNFVSGDFNPLTEQQGLLSDVTDQGIFAQYIKNTNALIDRQRWFSFQEKPTVIANNVRVINAADGAAMYQRFVNNYPAQYHLFKPAEVSITYIPKEVLVTPILNPDNKTFSYVPNEALINQMPVPSVVEIVRDASKWNINGVNIADIIGTQLNVSHVGLLYRQQFAYNQVIYQDTVCSLNNNVKSCIVKPIPCTHPEGCLKTMFLDSTDVYPSGYYFYQSPAHSGHYVCTATPPAAGASSTTCNRVTALPLGDYLATYQYGSYIFMTSPSIVGIHVERIN